MKFKYSLIVATYGRAAELGLLLESLCLQTIPGNHFEVIIVDQNNDDLAADLISGYAGKLNLNHIRSARKGLSHNRNLGIKAAKGEYLAFPDDDCEYYADTLQSAGSELLLHGMPDMIIGKVFNRAGKKFVFKKTPSESMEINKWNFYPMVSSITIIFKNNGQLFDENFGIGERYHSNEDGDMILNFLDRGKRIVYSPLVEFDHPPYNAGNMSLEKVFKYGIGFGALCRKHLSPALLFLFMKVIAFQVLMTLKELVLLNGDGIKRRFAALKGRISGFFVYSVQQKTL